MQGAFTFIISALLDLYVIALLLRFVLGMGRMDFRNPLAQAILRATNPLILPARRMIPPAGRLDTATLVVLLAVQIAGTAILVSIACSGAIPAAALLSLAILRLLHLVLRIWFLLILAHVVLSWINPAGGYNPVLAILAALVEPVLAPFRGLIPPLGPLDLSPIFALLAVEFLRRLIPAGPAAAGIFCLPF